MNTLSRFRAGTVIGVPVFGMTHLGTMTSLGTVIANSKLHRKVVEQSLEEFSDGRPITYAKYPSGLPWFVVEARARSLLGRPYDLRRSTVSTSRTQFMGWSLRVTS